MVNRDIPFYIRIKKSTVIQDTGKKPLKVERWLDDLKVGESKTQIRARKLYGQKLGFAVLKTKEDSVIIATNDYPSAALSSYKLRWSIESLFGQLKTCGFNFEETHLRCEKGCLSY